MRMSKWVSPRFPIPDAESALPSAALNGAQIQSLVSIATAVAEGLLPKDTGIQIIAASFPFTEERAVRILAEVMEGAIDKPEPPAPFGAVPPAPVPPVDTPEEEDGVENTDEENTAPVNEGGDDPEEDDDPEGEEQPSRPRRRR